MVGGIIKSFSIDKEISKTTKRVRFIVSDTPYLKEEYCCVKAEIPNRIIENNLIETGQSLWWHGDSIFLEIIGVPDNKFKKIGYSFGIEYKL